ncbi:MAG: hypothetical protein JXB19_12440 [Bacteroidales bacterium]|nr:hypothetical protein [Bacteroidales bacterium]
MIQLLAVVAVFVGLAFLMLGMNIFFFRRKFPETEVGKNKNMIRLGLSCPQCEEKKRYRRIAGPVVMDPDRLKPDWSDIKNELYKKRGPD